jgi:hypothetical protein
VEDVNFSDDDALADKVKINFNILDALMLDGNGGGVDRANVVAAD